VNLVLAVHKKTERTIEFLYYKTEDDQKHLKENIDPFKKPEGRFLWLVDFTNHKNRPSALLLVQLSPYISVFRSFSLSFKKYFFGF